LSDEFPFQNGLIEGSTLSPLLFNFPLDYAIRWVQENQEKFKLNRTHQILAYADDVNRVGENIDTKKENTEARKMTGVEMSPEKTKYMSLSRYQKAGQKHITKIANRSFEDVAEYKYL
jgi:hypothetical protein